MMKYKEIIQMEKEIAIKRYARLSTLIADVYGDDDDDHPPFTAAEKREFGLILADNMTPYEYSCDVQGIADIWDTMADMYGDYDDFDLTLEYIEKDNCDNVDDWIIENGLPLPGRDDMVEYLINSIDEKEYTNDNYDDVLDFLPDDCEFNLADDEIIHLFEVYVSNPEDSDNEC